jgi:hypothetical protein
VVPNFSSLYDPVTMIHAFPYLLFFRSLIRDAAANDLNRALEVIRCQQSSRPSLVAILIPYLVHCSSDHFLWISQVVFTWQNGDEGSVEKFSKRTVKVIVLPFFFKKNRRFDLLW